MEFKQGDEIQCIKSVYGNETVGKVYIFCNYKIPGDKITIEKDDNGYRNTYESNQFILYKEKINKKVSSKYIGVHFHKQSKKWRVQIRVDGKVKSLGLFKTEEDAVKVRDKAALKYYGKFAKLNKEIE